MNESQGIEETECPSKMASRARRSKILRWLAGKRSRWVAAAVVEQRAAANTGSTRRCSRAFQLICRGYEASL
jgi:hypothetical protein